MTRAEKILAARAQQDAGAFERRVVERVPEDIGLDKLTLECGHSQMGYALTKFELPTEKVSCWDCAAAWLKADDAAPVV